MFPSLRVLATADMIISDNNSLHFDFKLIYLTHQYCIFVNDRVFILSEIKTFISGYFTCILLSGDVCFLVLSSNNCPFPINTKKCKDEKDYHPILLQSLNVLITICWHLNFRIPTVSQTVSAKRMKIFY